MMLTMLVFPAAQISSTAAVAVGIVFFLIFALIALITFKMLKRTVKMAVRMAIVAVILLIALVGSLAFFMFGTGSKTPARKPANTRPAR